MSSAINTGTKPPQTATTFSKQNNTKTDFEKAFKQGRNAAMHKLIQGNAIHLINEDKPLLTDTETSWRIGWNTIVFSQQNIRLLHKQKKQSVK